MAKDRLFKGWLNPLQFLAVDEPWAHRNSTPSLESVLDFLCTPGSGCEINTLVTRYREISQEKVRLSIAPAEERILNKLVWPLRNAKASYMVANYLGTISLCGMVAEMVAVLLLEIAELKINNRLMTPQDQTSLYGSTFERLGQDRRIQILYAYDIIDDDIKAAFDLVRTTRRRYLHIWSQDHEKLPQDAIQVYQASISIVIKAIGQNFVDGKVVLNPALIKYLDRRGIFTESTETTQHE
jgi:hypothetical protein